ncbi:DUF421 domain-containing protein [Micrococcus sp. FDAARGOS_333]|uniref:DUF421 domain-containing protein n=1 Tax=Micrococcus sp. FDAARGOS_333 TaxID=1930558 RepID=UPI000B4E69AD|nr:YetF domain-containing protein [Micrococcus sp. FDAARGOS_333]PNL16815.1 DUF421 domain-containing protein [Micrococcus sp. FDAARGOS_333]
MTPPQGWGPALTESLGIELWRIPLVVLTAVVVYLAFLLLLRVFGARLLTGLSAFDTVVIIMFGAVAGRVILGHPPTLATGLIGLLTLVLLEVVFGALTATARGQRVFTGRARVIVAHGRVLETARRRAHVNRPELHAALRRAGVTSMDQVACVVMEASGHLSVMRAGQPIDPELLDGVVGADEVLRPD